MCICLERASLEMAFKACGTRQLTLCEGLHGLLLLVYIAEIFRQLHMENF